MAAATPAHAASGALKGSSTVVGKHPPQLLADAGLRRMTGCSSCLTRSTDWPLKRRPPPLGSVAYTYAALHPLAARVLVVEEGGRAFQRGSNIGAPDDDVTGKWTPILTGAGLVPGMYSWWNAIPYGLDRQPTADDKGRGRRFLRRAVQLHPDLEVVIAVGVVAQEVVTAARLDVKVLTTRSPLRTSSAQREEIRNTFERARLHAYPSGFDSDV